MENKHPGIYIHIPFCVRKCNYCAFLSYPASEEIREEYVNALIKECKEHFTSHRDICKDNFTSIDTIYFGGGTPSILETEQIERIISTIRNSFDVSDDAEITLEANPGTLGKTDDEVFDRLNSYRRIGINRLSMGVQSMNDERLKYLGRIHNSDEVKRDFALARKAGFDNINLDLIMSVPCGGSSLDAALEDVASIALLGPEHISCYSLQLEEGTKFFEMFENGEFEEVSDDIDRETYHEVCDYLKAQGYEHYEISNFAKPGRRSRHNSKYWDMSDYVGLGLGASGFISGTRYKNTEEMSEYLQGKCVAEEYKNTEHDNISEAVFLGLRRKKGIKYEDICKANFTSKEDFWNYYKDVQDEAREFEQNGYLIIDDDGLRLTESGIDISNKIMALFV